MSEFRPAIIQCPDFITKAEWPPYSPDLNPMDYSVWSILEAKACAKPHKTIESLKRALLKAWDEIPLETLVTIADNFPKRLQACVEAESGYFE
uniref:Transposase n=1 Tax=Acrobeloides nanus TaxID=290746 RepID=A0A914CNS1_9BILA